MNAIDKTGGGVAVQALDDGNQVRRLELTREGFFNLVSVVEAPEP
jgi:hypothetical protein